MKKKLITRQNSFKRLAIDPNGRLIDATKDVTEKDLAKIQYHKLQSEQFDQVSVFKSRNALASYFISLSVLVLFLAFAYVLIKLFTP